MDLTTTPFDTDCNGLVSMNVRGLMLERLPARAFILLETVGRIADQLGVSAYVVGGIVRDLLLGIGNLDLDLVIEGDGIAFARALADEIGGHVKAHERFGTAIVILPDGVKLDVATARTESYEHPAALPTVEPSSIKPDLSRRDFTINTLAIRLNGRHFGELIDCYGGRRDLTDKTIRALHNQSFVEDPTRVFRAIRFAQRFGFRLGKETLMLIKAAVKRDLFHRLSGQRLLNELILLFSEKEPRKAVARLGELGLLRFIHPSIKWSPRLGSLLKSVEDALDGYKIAALNWTDRKVGVGGSAPRGITSGKFADAGESVSRPVLGSSGPPPTRMNAWLVYFMALMEVLPLRAVGVTLKRLTMPAREAEKIRAGQAAAKTVLRRLAKRPLSKPSETYRALTGLSDETLLLLMAKAKPKSVKRQVSAYLMIYRHVKPALTGADLKALGLEPGPIYKKIFDRLLDARLSGEVKTKVDERELVRRVARSHHSGSGRPLVSGANGRINSPTR